MKTVGVSELIVETVEAVQKVFECNNALHVGELSNSPSDFTPFNVLEFVCDVIEHFIPLFLVECLPFSE